MTRSTRVPRMLTVGATALALALAGCSTTSDEEMEDPVSDFDQGDVSDQEVAVEEVADTAVAATAGDLGSIYFDFDRSAIREDARTALRDNAQGIRTSGVSVRLEGHADERGDEEYNLALGERRAQSVKRYLENLGVSGSQMRTLSYGEAKPAVRGHDESAWKWNRRVETHPR